ncbi:hypothetical protein Y032_0002g841 [Ancylostoma ceylanicum]|uniref:Major facilitator superfamily (MFS) profile domain-containing protein n=1 Tax=Ancylostoma ceylanicum TaxID=53326 RepID=A0A016W1M1_9BILA|nr:hypothetical protein Y032_0002g841 [Ancylostoma ceylanicum]
MQSSKRARTRFIILMGCAFGTRCTTYLRSKLTTVSIPRIYGVRLMSEHQLIAPTHKTRCYQKYGARSVFFTAGMISTISTAIMPITATYSWPAFLAARFLQGVSFGADFAAIGLIVVHWASLKQHGLFISLLSSFSQISVMFTMPVAGELCESSLGWPSVYYLHAAVSAVLFSAWFYYYRNNPAKHPAMTEIELEKIQRGKGEVKEKEPTPIRV